MHELPVTQGILEVALEHAARAGAARVVTVHLVVGELSGVAPACVEFYWPFVSAGTRAEGARLEFRRSAFELACGGCGTVFAPGEDFVCPGCGGTSVRVSAGEELRVEAIDVEGAAVGAAVGEGARGTARGGV